MVQGLKSLCTCIMRQHKSAGHIACGIDSWDIGAHVFIHLYSPLAVFYPGFIKAESFQGRLSSNCHKGDIGLYGTLLILFDIIEFQRSVTSDGSQLGRSLDCDSGPCKGSLEALCNVRIESGQNARTVLEHSHIAAEFPENGGEFKTYHSPAYDAESFGNFLKFKHFA